MRIPLTRHWLIPKGLQPKVYVPHPIMSADEIALARRASRIASTVGATLGAGALRRIAEVAHRVRADSSLYGRCMPTRGFDRQRAHQPVRDLGRDYREALSAALCGAADAGVQVPRIMPESARVA